MHQVFSEKDIKDAMWAAVKKLHDNDKQLILNKCSERAQVHHLAIYFDEAIRKCFDENHKDSENFPYKVDVEYNRVGDHGLSKVLYGYCQKDDECDKEACSDNCSKKKDERYATIDMVFHVRGRDGLQDNVFCLEVKPQQQKKSICDKKRIETLVLGSQGENPRYYYGLALHILKGTNGKLAEGYFYNRDKPEAEKVSFPPDKC